MFLPHDKARSRKRTTCTSTTRLPCRFADAYPNELSGGMKERAAPARALVGDQHDLLMDEPFASLDAQTREFMQLELMKIWYERRNTVVFVTRSVDEAILLGDRIVLLRPRPGQVAALRQHLWDRIRAMVAADPQSEFYERNEVRAG